MSAVGRAAVDADLVLRGVERDVPFRLAPNHVLAGVPFVQGGPASFAEAAGEELEFVDGDGEGVRVAVIDTGFTPRLHPWLDGRTDAPADTLEETDVQPQNGWLDDEAVYAEWLDRSVGEFLRDAAAAVPDRCALVVPAADGAVRQWTYRELLARMRAVLRRRGDLSASEVEEDGDVVQVGRIVMDRQRHEVTVDGALRMRPASADVEHRLVFTGVDESIYVGGGMTADGHLHEPIETDVGLWVLGDGVVDLVGAPKTAWTTLAGDVEVEEAAEYLFDHGIPAYPYSTEMPVAVLGAKYRWARGAGLIPKMAPSEAPSRLYWLSICSLVFRANSRQRSTKASRPRSHRDLPSSRIILRSTTFCTAIEAWSTPGSHRVS